jgi:hypothetical protein
MKFKAEYIDIGREKFNFIEEFEAKNLKIAENIILDEASKHLLSSEVEIFFKDDIYSVIVGGFRNVGKIILKQIK